MDDSNAPVTKADLAAAVAALNERHDMLRSEMQHMHDALIERIDDRETKLLQAVRSWQGRRVRSAIRPFEHQS